MLLNKELDDDEPSGDVPNEKNGSKPKGSFDMSVKTSNRLN